MANVDDLFHRLNFDLDFLLHALPYDFAAEQAIVDRVAGTIAALRTQFDGLLEENAAMRAESERRIRKAREEAYDDIQEFVVLHTFDTSAGRRIDDYITQRLRELGQGDAEDGAAE